MLSGRALLPSSADGKNSRSCSPWQACTTFAPSLAHMLQAIPSLRSYTSSRNADILLLKSFRNRLFLPRAGTAPNILGFKTGMLAACATAAQVNAG